MREHLETLARLLRQSGDNARAFLVEDAVSGSDADLNAFLTSNELWGGSGSVADCGGGAERTELRRSIEHLLIQLGNRQLRSANANPRTRMWVTAFVKWEQQRYIIWDFDGTLAYRTGQWTGALLHVLRRFANVEADPEMLRPFLRKGFPWHNSAQPNPPMRTAADWWAELLPVFEEAFVGCGLDPKNARTLAVEVRGVYTDISEWRLFDDTREVLHELMEAGWKHAILSNHVPELPMLVEGLELSSMIHRIVNSAETGYEKPHPGAFGAALAALETPADVWMVGDSISADVLGAEAAGLRAILVRSEDPRAQRCALSLRDVRRLLV
jgi:putative hydrolase of the HAD superfamily